MSSLWIIWQTRHHWIRPTNPLHDKEFTHGIFASHIHLEHILCTSFVCRAGLTIRGPHTNVRRGHFSHTRSQDFLWRWTFPPPKSWRFFSSRRYVYLYTKRSNVQTSKQRGQNLALDRPPPWRRGPSHGTTGTVVNPVLFVRVEISINWKTLSVTAKYTNVVQVETFKKRPIAVSFLASRLSYQRTRIAVVTDYLTII